MKFIYSYNLSALDNMVVDSYLAQNFKEEFIRIYRWKRATVSLGVTNRVSDLNREFITRNNIDIVRRETGGGIVYHDGDLSFCMVLNRSKGPKENYNTVRKIFENILKEINFNVTLSKEINNKRSKICFDGISKHEISVDNKKVIGIAQKIFKDRYLIQGTIQLKNLFLDNIVVSKDSIVQYGLKGITFDMLKSYIYNYINKLFFIEELSIDRFILDKNYQKFKTIYKEKFWIEQ